MDNYLKETRMLNYKAKSLEELVRSRNWKELDEFERIGAIYDYVRNEILFGYNRSDLLTAEEVLADGYGQCNTKATLLMALLRAVEIPCRLHGTQVSKYFQKGATSGLISVFAPKCIVHTWVEVLHKGQWIAMEGVITDETYVQNASVVKDYGVFESPDIFFSEHKQTWNRIKDFAYVHFGRKMMNRNVAGIRISARSVERRENTCEFQYNLR